MIIRILLLILLLGGSFAYFNFLADTDTKQKLETLLQDTTTNIETTSAETKANLLIKKEELENELFSLQKQVVDKVEQGQAKFEEVQANIVATKEAIDQVEDSINALNESLGIGDKKEDL